MHTSISVSYILQGTSTVFTEQLILLILKLQEQAYITFKAGTDEAFLCWTLLVKDRMVQNH